MPIYEMRCKNCGWEGQVEQKITDEPLEFLRHQRKGKSLISPMRSPNSVCSGQMVRLISKSSFVLEGGGWEKDGYSKHE